MAGRALTLHGSRMHMGRFSGVASPELAEMERLGSQVEVTATPEPLEWLAHHSLAHAQSLDR